MFVVNFVLKCSQSRVAALNLDSIFAWIVSWWISILVCPVKDFWCSTSTCWRYYFLLFCCCELFWIEFVRAVGHALGCSFINFENMVVSQLILQVAAAEEYKAPFIVLCSFVSIIIYSLFFAVVAFMFMFAFAIVFFYVWVLTFALLTCPFTQTPYHTKSRLLRSSMQKKSKLPTATTISMKCEWIDLIVKNKSGCEYFLGIFPHYYSPLISGYLGPSYCLLFSSKLMF